MKNLVEEGSTQSSPLSNAQSFYNMRYREKLITNLIKRSDYIGGEKEPSSSVTLQATFHNGLVGGKYPHQISQAIFLIILVVQKPNTIINSLYRVTKYSLIKLNAINPFTKTKFYKQLKLTNSNKD